MAEKKNNKKYKLRKPEDGEKANCAFYNSPQGCINGSSCKFLHSGAGDSERASARKKKEMEKPAEPDSSDISSESDASVASHSSHNESEKMTKKRKNLSQDTNIKSNPRPLTLSPSPFKFLHSVENDKSSSSQTSRDSKEKLKKVEFKHETKLDQTANSDKHAASKAKVEKIQTVSGAIKDPEDIEIEKPPTDFRSLVSSLPIASFETPKSNSQDSDESCESFSAEARSEVKLVLPKCHPDGIEWENLILKSREHPKFSSDFNFEKVKKDGSEWFSAKPYGKWCARNPQVIAIDCEMCGTKNPQNGQMDRSALCRLSVVDVKTRETLIDTLVKPEDVVVDDRAWVNGIPKKKLENVEFTLKHARAFMEALCSEETVILGHSIINDLRSLKMEHYCIVDSSYLYKVVGREHGMAGLRDLAPQVLGKPMPEIHCSVNDAKVAMECIEAFRDKGGDLPAIIPSKKPRPPKEAFAVKMKFDKVRNSSKVQPPPSESTSLLVHRIPRGLLQKHIELLFSQGAKIKPKYVGKIEFAPNCKVGKAYVTFSSYAEAEKAFDAIPVSVSKDIGGHLQKNVDLERGNYIRVRSNRTT